MFAMKLTFPDKLRDEVMLMGFKNILIDGMSHISRPWKVTQTSFPLVNLPLVMPSQSIDCQAAMFIYIYATRAIITTLTTVIPIRSECH